MSIKFDQIFRIDSILA